MAKDLNLADNYEAEKAITRKATTTGVLEAATGLSVTFRLSATRLGGAIHATLSVSATERSGTPGTYAAQFAQADLEAQLTPVASYPSVYLQTVIGGEIVASTNVRVVSTLNA